MAALRVPFVVCQCVGKKRISSGPAPPSPESDRLPVSQKEEEKNEIISGLNIHARELLEYPPSSSLRCHFDRCATMDDKCAATVKRVCVRATGYCDRRFWQESEVWARGRH